MLTLLSITQISTQIQHPNSTPKFNTQIQHPFNTHSTPTIITISNTQNHHTHHPHYGPHTVNSHIFPMPAHIPSSFTAAPSPLQLTHHVVITSLTPSHINTLTTLRSNSMSPTYTLPNVHLIK